MAQIYSENTDKCKLVKTSDETVKFLLSYSRSLNIVKHEGMTFENNLN
ncbi:hypothetical protein [Muriicola sp. Z0-33]|nr:hypothetical protein [Muriicola sp. Z0-33]MCW5516645.1 hypothetical protein [Muriicola sp. Z0-33]